MSTTAERLAAYEATELKILSGQSVRHNGRSIERANLEAVQKQISSLRRQLAREQRAAAGGGAAGSLDYSRVRLAGRPNG